jgi:hypothetical protein
LLGATQGIHLNAALGRAFPHNAKSWLGHGHTMPNGNPAEPFWGSKELDTLLFMPPIVVKDQSLPFELQIEGQPVHFLW